MAPVPQCIVELTGGEYALAPVDSSLLEETCRRARCDWGSDPAGGILAEHVDRAVRWHPRMFKLLEYEEGPSVVFSTQGIAKAMNLVGIRRAGPSVSTADVAAVLLVLVDAWVGV